MMLPIHAGRQSLLALLLWLVMAAAAHAAPGCVALDLSFGLAAVPWAPKAFSRFKRDTRYAFQLEGDRTILRAQADASASLYSTLLKVPVSVTPDTLSWRWKTDRLIPGADNREKDREDSPVRILVAFDGDIKSLPVAEQRRFALSWTLSGETPPYAVLEYVWSEQVPVGTVIASAHTSQVKMLVASSGQDGLGQWQSIRRNLRDDYLRAYGVAPGPMLSVAVMTDTDNTKQQAVGFYADIRLGCQSP
jgi:hypothetical protein